MSMVVRSDRRTAIIMTEVVVSVIVILSPILVSTKTITAQPSPLLTADKSSITRGGVAAYGNIAEFGPLTIGKASIVGTSSNDSIDIFSDISLPLTTMKRYNDLILRSVAHTGSVTNVTVDHAEILSNPIYQKSVNYIGATFRSVAETTPRLPSLVLPWNGITWTDGHNTYYAFLRPTQLVLFTNELGEIAWVPAASSMGEWDSLEVVYMNDIIHLFLNGEDKIQIKAMATANRTNSDIKQAHINNSRIGVEVVAQGLDFPTSMAFIGLNDILVTEKQKGTVQRVVNGQISPIPLLDVPVASLGERGMLGIAIGRSENVDSPQKHVYVFYTESSGPSDGDDITSEKEPIGNRVYRYTLDNGQLKDRKLLLDLPAAVSLDTFPDHNGGTILVGPNQSIYAVIGDLNERRTQAQNVRDGSEPDGTSIIYRIDKEGHYFEGNPFESSYGLNKYYAYGIRNSFGMDIDPVTEKLWNTENGPDHSDELNLVEPGFNSGWASVQGMISPAGNDSYNEDIGDLLQTDSIVSLGGRGNYSNPEFVWNIPIGVTAIKFLNSDKYGEEYENDIFVGDIINGNIYHFNLNENRTEIELDGELKDKIAHDREETDGILFGTGFGGITDIETGPDGYLYILAINKFIEDQTGTIYRIVPFSDRE